MKKLIFLFIITTIFVACENKVTVTLDEEHTRNEPPYCEDIEYNPNYLNETAPNFNNSDGLRHGHWCFYGKDLPARGYPDNGKIEEGFYTDGVKDKVWLYYKTDGKTVDSIVNYHLGQRISFDNMFEEFRLIELKNKADASGIKQGHWVEYNMSSTKKEFTDNDIIAEGTYKDDFKNGCWYYYQKETKKVDSIIVYYHDEINFVERME